MNNKFEFELAAFQSFTRYSSELIKRGKPCDVTHAYIELHTRAGELLQREVKTDDYQVTNYQHVLSHQTSYSIEYLTGYQLDHQVCASLLCG